MLPQEIIRQKRDNKIVSDKDIAEFVQGISLGSVSEGQAAAFAMATFLNGMTTNETVALTQSMRDSGLTLPWESFNLPGPVVDKHSSGGLGDNVSLMLAPIMAAVGGFVPMISGRGLGHTGGTLDKLESIPGYKTGLSLDAFQKTVRHCGCSIIGQTSELAPADRRLYAIRDITATVESIPLITASILSKKLAAGLQGLVMDIKCGNGAFMDSLSKAQVLAKSIVKTAHGADLPTTALITDMNEPLAHACGNALEVKIAIDFLKGDLNNRKLYEVTLALCSELMMLSGLAKSEKECRSQLEKALNSGKALEHFAKMIAAQGGPADFIEKVDVYLARAPFLMEVKSDHGGFIEYIDSRSLGIAVIELEGGRRRVEDKIDHRVGLDQCRALGEQIEKGEVLAIVHAKTESAANLAANTVKKAYRIGSEKPQKEPLIKDRIDG